MLNLINNNDRSLLNQLDWDNIIQKISSSTYFEESKELLFSKITLKNPSEITEGIKDTLQIIELIRQGNFASIHSHFYSLNSSNLVNDYIYRLAKGSCLSISELNQLAKTFECFTNLINNYPSISEIIHKNALIEKTIITEIRKNFVIKLRTFVSTEGNINFLAHPELSVHYLKLQEIEQLIKEDLKRILRSKQMEKILRYDQYDIMNDHFVVPIRSDSYNSGLGQIIAHSDSGLTLYVEPFSIKDKCNKRITLIAKIDEVLFNICKDFCEILTPHHNIFQQIKCSLRDLDVLMAKAKYSYDNDFCVPNINYDLNINISISIKGLFHPLIERPITNSINLSASQKGIIISGPNTGGKTVALKSLTLAHLFLHFGLLTPAFEATLYPFTHIYFFGHDQQDLAQGLSSFSAEVKNYLQLLAELKNERNTNNLSNLIVIDEIFNTTSSEEASALALSLFEEIDKNSSKIFVSTHHQMLKTIIHKNENYISCHVGYDFEEDKPTYKIISGTPGSSLAITIFKNLSKKYFSKHNIVENAHKLLDDKHIIYENLLQDLSKKELELNKLIEENKTLKKNLTSERSKIEGIYKLKMQCKYEEYDRNLFDILRDANQLIEEIKRGDSKQLKSYVKSIDELRSKVKNKAPSPTSSLTISPTKFSTEDISPIVGEKYYSLNLKKVVTLVSITNKGKHAMVKKDNVTIKVPISDLKAYTGQDNSSSKNQFHFSFESSNNTNTTCDSSDEQKNNLLPFHFDCRGMRVDEFESVIEKILDDLLTGDLPYAVIIHGHGTGALKKWLQTYLKQHPEFSSEVPEQSSYGTTKIFCK
ncbi:MAG: Smr/MutS family protein [Oligoflexia bacterium]|nr:Smr/MutS family protein [Oligoflexia bacterium]